MWSPKGPSTPDVVLRDVSFEDDLRVRRHLEVDRLAAHELDRLAAQEAGEHQLVEVVRERGARRVRGHGIEPDRDRNRDPPVLGGEQVGAPVLVHLPMHEGRALVDDLHAVHADVADTGLRVLRDHGGERDERRGIAGPAALDRQPAEVDVVALEDDLLAGALGDRLRERVRDRLQLEQALDLLDDPLGRLHVEHVAELRGGVVQLVDAEREAHAALGAELVDQERVRRPLRSLEQQRRPAGFDDAIDDLGDLEVGVGLGRDTPELALAFEKRDPIAEILRGRGHARSV